MGSADVYLVPTLAVYVNVVPTLAVYVYVVPGSALRAGGVLDGGDFEL